MEAKTKKDRRIGLCLSGGGSRAVAFHLGCLRAHHDLGYLDKVRVISSVSGGSVITGLYAYHSGDFAAFEERTLSFLRKGIARDALCDWILTGRIVLNLLNVLGVLIGHGVEFAVSVLNPGRKLRNICLVRRPFSRTNSVLRVFEKRWFRGCKVSDPKRNIETIVNACELQTTTAFRFGSREVRCWPYGVVKEEVPLSEAITASAAYPALLPALDRTFSFSKHGQIQGRRVILTDGGVYENLGLTPLLPDRDPKFSYDSPECDIIIACDAGTGIPRGWGHHQWLVPRLTQCFNSVMRRTQSGSFALLHEFQKKGKLKAFILSYLGQNDERLPSRPADFVPQEAVVDYPTDFRAMSEDNISLLSKRGEQLTKTLISLYWPKG
ncbi:MAG: patatin-like phospholipase family protein [Bdellovibrionota bacterium]